MKMESTNAAVAMVPVALQAEASSANARINVPVNLDNWRHLEEDVRRELIWLHQHLLDRRLTLKQAGEALNYDESTVFRVLKGTYEGNLKNVVAAIKSYQRLDAERGNIQRNEFVQNSISELIWSGLDYALANSSIVTIIGESRMGKTMAVEAWRDFHNHGRSVLMTAPVYGGTKALLRRICDGIGSNKNANIAQMQDSIHRAFNENRILIIDEAHRLLPSNRHVNPVNLEIIRELRDLRKCAVALIATRRFDDELRKNDYMFEQLLGRIGLPVRVPRLIPEKDVTPIVSQYLRRPSAKLMKECLAIANTLGRLGILVEILKVASRIAAKAHRPMAEDDFFKSVAIRRQMMGELQFAKKEAE